MTVKIIRQEAVMRRKRDAVAVHEVVHKECKFNMAALALGALQMLELYGDREASKQLSRIKLELKRRGVDVEMFMAQFQEETKS